MDYQKAQNYWVEKDKENVVMPEGELAERIKNFVRAHNTLALATGYGTWVRNTPVEYTLWNDRLMIMSEGGKKFIGLEKNPNVAIAIFDSYQGFGTIHGLQIEGTAELIEPFSQTYLDFLAYKKIPEAAIRSLPEPMPMIAIAMKEIDYLDSDLKKEGYSSRQHLSC